ncbi:hypothetical protein [Primorskyibacter sp. S187A]|uniref:hypothetical protein n=1 Tax=Primorskyibacter sp. S187A TaxID=3415130 RepID=UPI003C7AE3ED
MAVIYPLPVVNPSSDVDNKDFTGTIFNDTLHFALTPDRFNLTVDMDEGIASYYNTDDSRQISRTVIFEQQRQDSFSNFENIVGGEGGDVIRGDARDNLLVGMGADFGENHGSGAGFNFDTGAARSIFEGLQSTNVQHNEIYGGDGDDMVLGDLRVGDGAFDRLFGDAGEDTIDGGIGRGDEYTGGGGSDIFIFNNAQGTYNVMDFTNNLDILVIAGTDGVDGMEDLTITDTDEDHTQITFADTTITLRGVFSDVISDNDIVFL